MFKVKFGNKVETSNRVENWCNVLLMEGVTVYGHPPECHVTRGERDLMLLDNIPVPTIELLRYDSKRSLTYPYTKSLLESRPQNKTFIGGESSGISDEL